MLLSSFRKKLRETATLAGHDFDPFSRPARIFLDRSLFLDGNTLCVGLYWDWIWVVSWCFWINWLDLDFVALESEFSKILRHLLGERTNLRNIVDITGSGHTPRLVCVSVQLLTSTAKQTSKENKSLQGELIGTNRTGMGASEHCC